MVTNRTHSLTVKKVWRDSNDPARPVSVKVELQRKLESEEDSAYKKIAEAEFGVNSSPAWQHVFKGLEKTDKGTGETYQYCVLETAFILKNGETISVDNKDIFGKRKRRIFHFLFTGGRYNSPLPIPKVRKK